MARVIKNITPKNKNSYNNPIITFDFDWAHDDILTDTIEIIEKTGINATWFVTHKTPVLDRLIENPLFEVGIHPNFNGLLNTDYSNGRTAKEIMDRLFEIVPNARSLRSHSLTQSSQLYKLFQQYGITHDSNDYLPSNSGMTLHPWELESGLIKVPYFWSDETSCLKQSDLSILDLLKCDGLKVFNFHPVHIFLNTEHLNRYENTRIIHKSPKELIKERYRGYGVRNKLFEIIKNI
ncbi:MAG: hypothetical protein ACJZ12_01840 [Candidatus Neomarinimicrobiota bacterium]